MKTDYKQYSKIPNVELEKIPENNGPVVEDLATSKEEVKDEVIKEEIPNKDEGRPGEVVNCRAVNLRLEPSLESVINKILYKGEKVKIIKETGDFYFVKYNSFNGYIHKDYVTEI